MGHGARMINQDPFMEMPECRQRFGLDFVGCGEILLREITLSRMDLLGTGETGSGRGAVERQAGQWEGGLREMRP